MTAPAYITPLEQSVLAWPSFVRPEELGPGRTSLITHTGTGGGSLLVTGAAFDAHTIRVEIVTGGEPGVATYRARTEGATWGDTTLTTGQAQALLHSAADELTGGADIGLRVQFVPGTAPSFVAGDAWTWTTKPVQRIQVAIRRASGDAKSLISGPDGGGQYTGDILSLDDGVKGWIADLVRQILAESRGYDPQSEAGKMIDGAAARATAKLTEVGAKLRFPQESEAGPAREAPAVALGNDRFGISRAYRGGRSG